MTFYMETGCDEVNREHCVLLRHFAALQERCTVQARSQAREIEKLNAQILRLRGQLIIRESALAWERENLQAVEREVDKPKMAASPLAPAAPSPYKKRWITSASISCVGT